MSKSSLKEQLGEMLQFLSTKARVDLRCIALQYVVGLTGTDEGCNLITSNEQCLANITEIAEDTSQPSLMKDAYFTLINLSTRPHCAEKIATLSSKPDFILNVLKSTLDREFPIADISASLITNLSRYEKCAKIIFKVMTENQETVGFEKLIFAFCDLKYNEKANLHVVGSVLANLSHIEETRKYILDRKRCVVQRLLPFTDFAGSEKRRQGIINTLYNCCFETEYHSWLLSDEVDILPRLLLPLAGPEDIDEEDMDKLPVDLQYLEPDKKREPLPEIRKILCETLFMLCTLKENFEYIREKNTYVILQKLHLWESDPAARHACECVVHLLISEEPAPDNLSEVEIPENIEKTLKKGYEQIQRDIEDETKQLQLQEKENTKNENS